MDPFSLIGAVSGPLIGAAGQYLGAKMASDATREANDKNAALQREFAQNGIRWKMEDAKRAGIHPLAALGISGANASPSYVGDTAMGSAVGSISANMGQDISRAVSATRTGDEREIATLNLASAKANLDGQTIQNQIALEKLKQLRAVGPPMAGSDNFIPGQGNSPLVKEKPLERTVSAPGRPAQEAGWRPDVSYSRTDTGLTPMVPESLSESLEDDVIGKILWRARNQLLPNFGVGRGPDTGMLPKGHDKWEWNVWTQEYEPVKSKNTYRSRETGGFTIQR